MVLTSTLVLVVALNIIYILILVVVMNNFYLEHNKDRRNSQMQRMQMALQQTEHDLESLAYWGRKILQIRDLQKLTYMYDDLDWYTRFSLQRTLQNDLIDLKNHNMFVSNVWLYIPEIGKTISNNRTYANQETWFQDLPEKGEGLFRNTQGQIVYMVTELSGIGEHPSCVIVELDMEACEAYSRIAAGEGEGTAQLYWLTTEDSLNKQKGNYLSVRGTSYPIIMTLNLDETEDEFISEVTRFGIAFSLFSTILTLTAILIWRRKIYLPLEKLLTEAFEKMRKGDFHYRIHYNDDSPFDVVYSSYNEMMEKME